jgi:hypothetical protein
MLAPTPLHQLVDRTTLEPWRKLLLDGADYVEKHGHCKYALVNERGQVCLLGALRKTMPSWEAEALAHAALIKCVGAFSGFLAGWNDAPERTADEVIDAMRACAMQGVDIFP